MHRFGCKAVAAGGNTITDSACTAFVFIACPRGAAASVNFVIVVATFPLDFTPFFASISRTDPRTLATAIAVGLGVVTALMLPWVSTAPAPFLYFQF